MLFGHIEKVFVTIALVVVPVHADLVILEINKIKDAFLTNKVYRDIITKGNWSRLISKTKITMVLKNIYQEQQKDTYSRIFNEAQNELIAQLKELESTMAEKAKMNQDIYEKETARLEGAHWEEVQDSINNGEFDLSPVGSTKLLIDACNQGEDGKKFAFRLLKLWRFQTAFEKYAKRQAEERHRENTERNIIKIATECKVSIKTVQEEWKSCEEEGFPSMKELAVAVCERVKALPKQNEKTIMSQKQCDQISAVLEKRNARLRQDQANYRAKMMEKRKAAMAKQTGQRPNMFSNDYQPKTVTKLLGRFGDQRQNIATKRSKFAKKSRFNKK